MLIISNSFNHSSNHIGYILYDVHVLLCICFLDSNEMQLAETLFEKKCAKSIRDLNSQKNASHSETSICHCLQTVAQVSVADKQRYADFKFLFSNKAHLII